MSQLSAFLKGIERGIASLIPGSCVGCGRLGDPLCSRCLQHLPGFREPYCRQCFLELSEEGPCPFCKGSPLQWVLPLGSYRPPLKGWVERLKFTGIASLLLPLARALAERLNELELAPREWCLIPNPPGNRASFLHPFPLPERLARELSRFTGIPVSPLLQKLVPTPPQRTLPRSERLSLGKEKFLVLGELPATCTAVILVDDLCTTGATLSALAHALKERYPGLTVAAAVLARTQSP